MVSSVGLTTSKDNGLKRCSYDDQRQWSLALVLRRQKTMVSSVVLTATKDNGL